MILFWGAAALLTVAALAALLWPLLRTPRPGAEVEEPIAALYRRQLVAIDVELAQGRLTAEQAAAGRAEVTRRLLAAAAHDSPAATPADESVRAALWQMGAAIGIAGLLPVAAIAVYFAVGTPAAIDPGAGAAAAIPHGEAELAAAADRIKAHLQQVPGDLRGWILLARTDASLGRFPAAHAAYARAISLAPDRIGLHAELGEVLVLAADGTVTPAAAAEFAKAPDDPRARYYAAEAAAQRGDLAGARQKLQTLLASAPAEAPWRRAVTERLAELSPETPAPTAAAPGPTAPGPTAQDIAAARSLSPEQRQAMIRGMVEGLAQKLERNPGDEAGWARLAHAYDVLGEPDKAAAARAREATADPGTAGAPAAAAPPTAAPVGTAGATPR
ncbi:MAG: c-type cytochrome biogenesis protein CcmI [Stellaceae bacterium]